MNDERLPEMLVSVVLTSSDALVTEMSSKNTPLPVSAPINVEPLKR